MGISKAIMEKLAVAKSRITGQGTVICCTRYGNVMASRGSGGAPTHPPIRLAGHSQSPIPT